MSNIAKNEMSIHVPLCVYPEPEKIYVDALNGFTTEAKRHEDVKISHAFDDKFQVIVIDAKALEDNLQNVKDTLQPDGVLVLYNLPKDFQNIAKSLEFFDIIMPYTYGYKGYFEYGTNLFCSYKYHPTADIILQKADLIDGLSYYNSDIHISAFTLPTSVKKSVREFIKI